MVIGWNWYDFLSIGSYAANHFSWGTSEFAGKEHQAVWGFSVLIGVMLLPVLISFLGASAAVAKLVLVLGLVGNLIMILAAWQYGVRASAGYITLVIAVFVLLPQGLALWRTFQWVRA